MIVMFHQSVKMPSYEIWVRINKTLQMCYKRSKGHYQVVKPKKETHQ